jgi:hypothetical protein
MTRRRRMWSHGPQPVLGFTRLMTRYRGVDQTITAQDIATVLGIDERFPDRVVRELAYAATLRGVPVAAIPARKSDRRGGGGYFVVTSEHELARVLVNYRARIRGIEERMRALTEAFRHGPPQTGLFDDPAGPPPPPEPPGPEPPAFVATVPPRSGRRSRGAE